MKKKMEPDVFVKMILDAKKTFREVNVIENASSVNKRIIRNRKVWALIFKRDFPAIFSRSSEPGTLTMTLDVKRKLNRISEHPAIESTDWKRFYEYIERCKRIFIESNGRPSNDYTVRYIRDSFNLREIPNVDGQVMPLNFSLTIRHNQDKDIFYIYPLMYSSFENPDAKNIPSRMQTITFDYNNPNNDNVFLVKYVPFDNSVTLLPLLNLKYFADGVSFVDTILSNGFSWIRLVIDYEERECIIDYTEFGLRNISLVSCVICNQMACTKCEHCDEPYCGVECQKTTH